MKIFSIINAIISAVYPNKCICCGEILEENKFLCKSCDSGIERFDIENFCLNCGFEKEECICKYSVFRFDAIVCVFKNIDFAQQAYYSYKFARKKHYAKFFAQEIADAVNRCFDVETIDVICAVPSYNKFGYDHSGYLASAISKKLNIPYFDHTISCIKKTKKQHKSSIKERLINVVGKYKANERVDGMRILLIDDIKTTGATLDECAKVLRFAGAESVLCATALGSIDSKNKN